MLTKELLIKELEILKDNLSNKKQITINNKDQLLTSMLYYIGDLDPYLRDKLIYSVYYYLILETDYLSKEYLINLLEILLNDDYLFFEINNHNNDKAVFKRSFVVLVIGLIINKHNLNPFINLELKDKIINSLINYANKEFDYRGYHNEYGWAHAVAHYADTLEQLSSMSNQVNYFEIISNFFKRNDYLFIHNEDQRLAIAIKAMVNKGLLVSDFINSFSYLTDSIVKGFKNDYFNYCIQYNNLYSFYQSCYFYLDDKKYKEVINELIKKMLIIN